MSTQLLPYKKYGHLIKHTSEINNKYFEFIYFEDKNILEKLLYEGKNKIIRKAKDVGSRIVYVLSDDVQIICEEYSLRSRYFICKSYVDFDFIIHHLNVIYLNNKLIINSYSENHDEIKAFVSKNKITIPEHALASQIVCKMGGEKVASLTILNK